MIDIVDPMCQISGPTEVCPGVTGVSFTVAETSGVADPMFTWRLAGPCMFMGGGKNAEGDMVVIDFPNECGTCEITTTVTAGGCSATCSHTVSVDDDEPPMVVGTDQTIPCNTPTAVAATITDNCTPTGRLSNVGCTVEFSPPGSGVSTDKPGAGVLIEFMSNGTATVTCQATDACGNVGMGSFTVSAVDCEVFCCDPDVEDDQGQGECEEANGTPCCRIERCCELVCHGEDPLPECCAVVWDELCAERATEICIPTGDCPGEGDCFVPNGTPGCDDEACCELICAISFFCCVIEWDVGCAEQAQIACVPMPEPPGDDGAGDPPAAASLLQSVGTGSWHDGAAWSGGATPDRSNDALVREPLVIDRFGAVARRVTLDADLTLGRGSLIARETTVMPGARLRLDDPASMVLVETLDVARDGILDWAGGLVEIDGGRLRHEPGLTVGLTGRVATLRLLNGAIGDVDGDLLVAAAAGSRGRVEVDGGGTTLVASTLQLAVAGDGTLVITDGAWVWTHDAYVGLTPDASGTLIVSDATFTSNTGLGVGVLGDGSVTVIDGGEIAAPNALIGPLGRLAGDGVVTADVSNEGVIDAGPGPLTIAGHYDQEPAGTLSIVHDPSRSEALRVTGEAWLAGTLVIDGAAGAPLQSGDEIVVIAAERRVGMFTRVVVTGAGPLEAEVSYEPHRVVVRVR